MLMLQRSVAITNQLVKLNKKGNKYKGKQTQNNGNQQLMVFQGLQLSNPNTLCYVNATLNLLFSSDSVMNLIRSELM